MAELGARARLGAFSLLLVGTFATAYAIGERLPGHSHAAASTAADGSGADSGADSGSDEVSEAHDHGGDAQHGETSPEMSAVEGDHGHGDNGAGAGVAGLTSIVDGYSVRVVQAPPADDGRLAVVVERNGSAVTEFDVRHGARLHLIVASPDLSDYQHLHPLMAPDGTWSVPFEWHAGGMHRLVVDLQPSGAEAMALGIDLRSPLAMNATSPLPPTADDVTTPEGLRVLRDGGRFLVSPADGLEPYLGLPAHLVGFRAGNLAYRHLHALDTGVNGLYEFALDLPPGTWRLFLQFSRLGDVVTVPFTVEVSG